MNKIHVLSSNLVDQIAAGEVIERPASVVKELIDNSIDANATEIKININDGGKSFIQVNDNGDGMSKDDLTLSFQRHATSKINKHSDLENIKTMGFRGEALPSIASVSIVKIKSNIDVSSNGYEFNIKGGKESSLKPVVATKGTSISIRELFYNTPARKKFLKANNTEYQQITKVVRTFLLSNPKISFKYKHNDKLIYDLPSQSLESRLTSIYGDTISQSLIKVYKSTKDISIGGYIGNLNLVKKRPSDQYLFVNDRYIKDRLISSSINKAYLNLIERGEFPFYVLNISLDPKTVDFNVHPTKKEIRFENEWKIYQYLKAAIEESLSTISNTIPNYNTIKSSPTFYNNNNLFSSINNSNEIQAKPINIDEILDTSIDSSEDQIKRNFDTMFNKEQESVFSATGEIWQIAKKYLFTEINDGLVIIDQHVAHERILYEEALDALEGDGLSSQTILFPETIKFLPDEYDSFLSILKYLEKIGFKVREFGKHTIIVEGLPSSIPLGSEDNLLKNILDEYITFKDNDVSFIHNIAATYACKGAIKAGDKLEKEEMSSLINQLFSTNNPYYCPHGRPIIVRMSEFELDKRFERK